MSNTPPRRIRAAIYARYSNDLQRPASIEDQIRVCRAHAEQHGWEVVEIYSDAALSGQTADRSGLQDMLDRTGDGAFDVILAEALDRLSRDQADTATIYKIATYEGVRIETLLEGAVDEMKIGFSGTMNAVFLINLKKKTHRGLVGRVENGRSAGGISYGYRVVREIDARGEFERGIREIVPEQAAIVIRIFEAYANGHSPRQIAAELNAEGIPAPKLGPWDKSSITGKPALGTGILNNPLYNGMIVWNREKTVRNPRTDKYVLKPNPESEWVRKEVPELRIVPQALWDRVRARQAARMVRDRQDAMAWQQRPPKFLFTGLMRCGCCGGNVSSMGNERYGCSNARTKGRAICTNRSTVSRKDMDARVLGALADRLMDPDLVKAFVDAYAEELKKLSEARKPDDIAARKRELGKVIADQDRLVEALISGVPAERVKARMEGLAARQKVLEAELAREVTPPPANPIRPDLADAWHDRIRALVASVSDPDYAGETREHIRSLVEKVVMYPVPGPGKRPRPALDLHGALAQILRLGCLGAGAGPKETAQIEAGLAQTQVLMETRGGQRPPFPAFALPPALRLAASGVRIAPGPALALRAFDA